MLLKMFYRASQKELFWRCWPVACSLQNLLVCKLREEFTLSIFELMMIMRMFFFQSVAWFFFISVWISTLVPHEERRVINLSSLLSQKLWYPTRIFIHYFLIFKLFSFYNYYTSCFIHLLVAKDLAVSHRFFLN